MFRKTAAISRNRNQILEKVSIGHCSHEPLSCALLISDGRDERHDGLCRNAR